MAEFPGFYRLTASGTLDTTYNTIDDGTYLLEDLSSAGNPDDTGTWEASPCD
jgi:hypothetical protein